MEIQTQDLKRKLEIESTNYWFESKRCKDNFQAAVIYGIGVPSAITAVSYLSNPETAEACRTVASWTYIAFSPLIMIRGARYSKAKALYSNLLEIIKEINFPGKTNLGARD